MTRFEIDINKADSLFDLSNALQDIYDNNYDINFNQLVTIKESVLNDGTFFKDFKQDMYDNIFIDPVQDNCNNDVEIISDYHDIKLILPKLGIDDVSSTELEAEKNDFITPFIYKSYTDGMFTNTDRDYKNLIEIKSDSQDISSIEIDVSYILQEDNIPRTDISFKELRENIDGEEMIGTIQFLRISGFKITRGDSEVIIYGTTIKYNAIIGYTIQNLWHNSLQDIENLHWTRRWQKWTYNIGLYNKNIDLIINESNKYLFPIIFPIIDDERILILPSLDKSIFIALITYNNNQYITSFEDESKYNIFKDLWENFNNNPSIDNIPFIYINVHELYITITNKLLNYPLLKIDDNSELVELDNVFYNYNINLENYDVSYQRTRSLSQIEYLKFQTSDTSYVEMVNIQSLMLLKHFIFDPNGSTDTGFYYKRSGFDIHLNVFAWRANIQDILYATHFHYTGNRYYHNTLWYNSDINILSLSSDIENLKNPMKIKLYTTQDNDYHKMNYELSNLNEYEISGGLYFKTDGGDTNLTYNYTKYIFISISSQFFISNHSLFNYNRYNLYVFSIISRSTNNQIYSSSEWITHIFSTYYNTNPTNVKTLSIMKTDQLILSKLEIIYNESIYATKNAITPDYTTLEFHILLNSLPVPMNITDYFSIFYEHMLMFVDTIGKVYLTSTYDLCSNYITDVSIALNDISDNFYDAVYTTGEILYSIYFLNETSFNDIESFTTLNNGIINIISEFRNTIFENTIEPYEEVLNENNDQVSISESLIYSYQIYHRNRYNFSYDIFVHFKNINRTKYIYIEFIPKHISTTVLNEYTKVETNDSYNDLLDILLNVKNESNYDNIHIYFIMSIDRFQAYINNKPNILREGQMNNANLHYILYYHKDSSDDEDNNNFLAKQNLSTIQPQYISIENNVVEYKNIQSHILLHLYLFSKLEIDKIDVNLNDITQTDIYPLHIDYNSIDGKYVTYKINHHIHILPVEMHNITQSSISDNHAIYFMKNNHKLDFDTTDENKKFRINKDDETSDFKDIIILQLDQPPFDYDKEISDIFASEDDKIYNHAYVTLYSINKNLTDSVDQFFNTIKYITDNNTKSYYNLFNHNDFTNIIYEFEFEYNKHYMQDRITEINYFETDEDTFVFLRMEPKSDYILDACLETNNNDLIIPEDYYYIKIGYHSICLFKDIRTIEFDVNLPDENIYPSKDVCGNDILRINPSTTDTFGIYPMIENYIMYNICIDISCIEYWNKSENNDSLSFFISILKEFKSQFTVYIDCSGATCDVFYDNFDGGICKVKIKQNAINNYHIESFHIPNHFDNKTIYLISSMNGIPFASQHMDVSITPNDSNTQPNISFDYKHAGTISVITLDHDANRQFEITSTNTLTEITLQNYIINMRNLYNNIIRDSSNHIIDVSNSKFYIETVWKENIERVYGGFVLGFERFKQFKSQIYIGLVHMEYYRRVQMILSRLQLYRFSVDYIDYLQDRLNSDLSFSSIELLSNYFSEFHISSGTLNTTEIQKLMTEIENLDVSTNTYPRKDIDGYYDNVLDYESKSKELYETSRNKRYNYVSQLKLKTNEKKLLLQQDNIIPISMKNSLSILERKYISISETLNSLKSEIDKAKALLFLRHIKYRSILNEIFYNLLEKITTYLNDINIVDDIDTFLVDCFKDDKYFTHLDKFKIYKEFIRLQKYLNNAYLSDTDDINPSKNPDLNSIYTKLEDNSDLVPEYEYDSTISTVFAYDLPYAMEFSDFGVGFYEQNVIKDLENTYSSVLDNNHSSSSSPSSPPPKYYDPYNPINEDFGSNDYIQKNKDAFGQYINLLGYVTKYHTILGNYTTSSSDICSNYLGDISLTVFYNGDEKTLGNNDYTLGDIHRVFINFALVKTILEDDANVAMDKDGLWEPAKRYERRRYLGYHIKNYKYAEIIEDYNEYWEESTSKDISFIQNYQKSAKNMVYLASCIYKYISKFDMTDKQTEVFYTTIPDIIYTSIKRKIEEIYNIQHDPNTIKNTYKSMYPYLIDTLQEIYFNIPDKNIGKDQIFNYYDINLKHSTKHSTSDYDDIISYPLNTYRLNIDTVIENIYYIELYNNQLYNSYITGFRNTEITLKNSYDSISGDYRDIVDICSNFDALMHNAGIVIDKISGYDYIQEYLAFPKDDLSMQVIYGPSLIESYSEWDLSINDLMDTQKDIIYEIEIRQNKLNNNHLDDTEMIYPLDYDSNEDPIMNDYDINTLSYAYKLGNILDTLKTVFMTIKEIDDYQYDKYIHFISSISETISHVLYFIQNNEFRDNLNSLFETVDNYATHIILIMRTSISQSYITNPHKLKNDTMFNIDYGTMFTNPTFSIEDEHIGTTFIIIGNNIKFIKDYIFNYIIDICSNTYTQTDMDFSGIFVLHETIEVFNYSFELIEEMGDNHKYKTYHKSIISTYFNLLKNGIKFVFEKINGYIDADSITYNDYNTIIQSLRLLYSANNIIIEIVENIERVGYESKVAFKYKIFKSNIEGNRLKHVIEIAYHFVLVYTRYVFIQEYHIKLYDDISGILNDANDANVFTDFRLINNKNNKMIKTNISYFDPTNSDISLTLTYSAIDLSSVTYKHTYSDLSYTFDISKNDSLHTIRKYNFDISLTSDPIRLDISNDESIDISYIIFSDISFTLNQDRITDYYKSEYMNLISQIDPHNNNEITSPGFDLSLNIMFPDTSNVLKSTFDNSLSILDSSFIEYVNDNLLNMINGEKIRFIYNMRNIYIPFHKKIDGIIQNISSTLGIDIETIQEKSMIYHKFNIISYPNTGFDDPYNIQNIDYSIKSYVDTIQSNWTKLRNDIDKAYRDASELNNISNNLGIEYFPAFIELSNNYPLYSSLKFFIDSRFDTIDSDFNYDTFIYDIFISSDKYTTIVEHYTFLMVNMLWFLYKNVYFTIYNSYDNEGDHNGNNIIISWREYTYEIGRNLNYILEFLEIYDDGDNELDVRRIRLYFILLFSNYRKYANFMDHTFHSGDSTISISNIEEDIRTEIDKIDPLYTNIEPFITTLTDMNTPSVNYDTLVKLLSEYAIPKYLHKILNNDNYYDDISNLRFVQLPYTRLIDELNKVYETSYIFRIDDLSANVLAGIKLQMETIQIFIDDISYIETDISNNSEIDGVDKPYLKAKNTSYWNDLSGHIQDIKTFVDDIDTTLKTFDVNMIDNPNFNIYNFISKKELTSEHLPPVYREDRIFNNLGGIETHDISFSSSNITSGITYDAILTFKNSLMNQQ